MSHFPSNATGAEEPNIPHRLWQTQSYGSPLNPATHWDLDGTRDDFPANKVYRSSSFRLPGKVSGTLLSKISKFEALDASKVPYTLKHPQLAPAPLHFLQETPVSSRHQFQTDVGQNITIVPKILSTTFSPSSHAWDGSTRVEENQVFSASELDIDQGGTSDSFDAKNLQSTLDKIKARIADTTIEVQYKPSSIRLREGRRNHTISNPYWFSASEVY
jgi:hypothetical protein